MEDTLTNLALNIDKSRWELVKFGDVAFEPKETCNDILKEGIEHVVGLEHITTGDIRLRNSATIGESTTFSKKFKAGDVLFGRRRAYLKKAAQASFGGICSGDITVFRAKKNLLPALLPFIVSNDKFFDYAIKHSAGGLSPRVKFKDLANYEFLLPPKEEQEQLAELLWAMDEVIEKEEELLKKLSRFRRTMVHELFNKGIGHSEFKDSPLGQIPTSWQVSNLKSMISYMKSGLSRRIVSDDIGIPILISGNIQDDKLNISDLKYWYKDDPQGADVSSYILKDGDILLCFINSLAQIGKCCIFKDIGRDAIYTTNLFRITTKPEIDNKFLHFFLSSEYAQKKIKQITKPAVNQASFTKEDFLKITSALPPFEEQILISDRFTQIDSRLENTKLKQISSQSLQKSLINQIF